MSRPLLSPAEVTDRRCRAQLLSGTPARDPVAVAERLLAVQAQDPRGFRLAVRARTGGDGVDRVEAALDVERSLIVTTLNRGTLHLVRVEDYWWLHALTTPPLATASNRRLAQTGVSVAQAERGVEVVVAALGADGPLTRDELRVHLDSAGVPTAGQALVHVLTASALRGLTVRGPLRHGQQAWVLVADWLGPRPAVERAAALAALARRYLAGHGPATDRDLARWAGLALGDVRAGLAAIGAHLVDLGGGLVDLLRSGDEVVAPPPRLLGAFDPLLLGWCDRAPIVGPATTLVTDNGIFRPFALVGGRAVAAWGLSGGRLTIRPFRRLGAGVRRSLTVDAVAVGVYLGLPEPPIVAFEPPS